jgi:hypothetical protein
MSWINAFRSSGEAERADPSDETVINGAPYDAQRAIRSNSHDPTASGDRSEAIAEEIRRRQISAVVRYVSALRAR